MNELFQEVLDEVDEYQEDQLEDLLNTDSLLDAQHWFDTMKTAIAI